MPPASFSLPKIGLVIQVRLSVFNSKSLKVCLILCSVIFPQQSQAFMAIHSEAGAQVGFYLGRIGTKLGCVLVKFSS